MHKYLSDLWRRFVPPKSVQPPAWWSDNSNTGNFDGEIVGHRSDEVLESGVYWVRDIGSMDIYRRYLDFNNHQSFRL